MSENHARLDALDISLREMFDGLSVFAVGGAVRALFTGNPISDIDLMVAGVEPNEMVQRGFHLVVGGNTPNDMTNRKFRALAVEAAEDGRLVEFLDEFEGTGFPVFIDADGREIALARMERSTGNGHREFEVVANDEVTVEDDLKRRDLRCNAMAVALADTERFDAGNLIDPFDGRGDIEQEVVRMVRPETFNEDPLRILRMARFAARLGFAVEAETLDAARENVDGLHELPHERWGMELVKAMKQADRPARFFRLLDDVDALDIVLPELAGLKGVPAGPKGFHREEDAFEHTMLVLNEMANLRPGEPRAMFAAMAHDLGKGLTPESELPSHYTHHKDGVPLMAGIQERLVLPDEFRGVMETASRHHMKMHDIEELNAPTVLELVELLRDDYEVDNPGDEPVVTHITLDELIDLAVADSRGRIPSGDFNREFARERFDRALTVLDGIGGEHIFENFDAPEGKYFGDLLHQERVRAFRDPEAFGLDA